MNLRDFKYLIAVAKYKHFGKAAKACFVSQPTLSYQIKKLEEFLGVKIFERDNQNVVVTAVGKKILEKAEDAVSSSNAIVDIAKLSKDPFQGELVLGVIPTISPYLLPKIIIKLKNKYPNLKILIREDTTENLIKGMKDNYIDAMIQALPMYLGNMKTEVFFKDEFFVAIPEDHDWKNRKYIRKEELQNQNVLLLESEHCLTGHILEHLCKIENIQNDYDFKATSLETLRQMVIGGVAITIMPKLAMDSKQKGIAYIPFEKPMPYRDIALVWKPESVKNILLEDMYNELKKLADKIL